MTDLDASYRYCRTVARRAASSFCWSFRLLPDAKRRSMYALYAFSRHTDDLADSGKPAAERRDDLMRWRCELEQGLVAPSPSPILLALADTAERHAIPARYLFEVVDGVMLDTAGIRFDSFAELEHYCYLVASSVGLACIHIWGFSDPRAIERAIDCGTAFQLTNILRDLHEDAKQDRVYIPRADLDRYGVSIDHLRSGKRSDRVAELVRFETDRAAAYYRKAVELADCLHPDGWRVLRLMMATYWCLLCKVRQRGARVMDRPLRVGSLRRLALAGSVLLTRRRWDANCFCFTNIPRAD